MLVEGRSAHQTGSAAGSSEGRILPAWGESMRLKCVLLPGGVGVFGCVSAQHLPRHITLVSSLASLYFLVAVDVISAVLWLF